MLNMVELIKKAAVDAVNASYPVAILTGDVISTFPLKIKIEQRLILEKEHLILSSLVSDITVETENAPIKLKLGLKQGEKVILVRVQGGQQFLVLDRVR